MALNNLICLPSGYGLPCRGVAGVSPYGVFLAPWVCPLDGPNGVGSTQSLSYTFNADGSILSFGGTASFVQYCQDNEIASLLMTPDASNVVANGTFYSADAVEFTLFETSQQLINEINIIGNGRWRGLIIGNDGNIYLMGLYTPASITSAAGGINKMMGDLNGFTVTLESHEQRGLTLITGTGYGLNIPRSEQIQDAWNVVNGWLVYNV